MGRGSRQHTWALCRRMSAVRLLRAGGWGRAPGSGRRSATSCNRYTRSVSAPRCCGHHGRKSTNAKILVLAPRRGIECCYLVLWDLSM